ncbi:unnamed protein product, partial [Rotaria sp. Silwood2]
MNYNNYRNQLPLQSTTALPPVPRYMMNNQRRRAGGAYKSNPYNYQYRNYISNENNMNNNNNNINGRQNNNISYNRNFQQRYNQYSINNDSMGSYYGYNSGPPRPQNRLNLNRRKSRSGSTEQRRSGPRHLKLNDFMPPQLRDSSSNLSNLPSDFNLANDPTTENKRPNTPTNALPQRPNFSTQTITTANNTTQPFVVDHDSNNLNQQQQSGLHRQTTNTSSYRRRQRRVRQQKYRNTA